MKPNELQADQALSNRIQLAILIHMKQNVYKESEAPIHSTTHNTLPIYLQMYQRP